MNSTLGRDYRELREANKYPQVEWLEFDKSFQAESFLKSVELGA